MKIVYVAIVLVALFSFPATVAMERDQDAANNVLIEAAHTKNVDLASQALARGADVNIQDNHGRTALHIATQLGDIGMMARLIAHGADVNKTDTYGNTALYDAIRQDNNVAKLLVDHGAKINNRNTAGATVLNFAAARGCVTIAEWLITQNADVNTTNKRGLTPLSAAARYGYFGMLKLLVDCSAHLNAQDVSGKTALHHAILEGYQGLAKFLIVHGSNLNIQDSDGNTALHIAAFNNYFDIIYLLLIHGANTDLKDRLGETYLDKIKQRRLSRKQSPSLLEKALMKNEKEIQVQLTLWYYGEQRFGYKEIRQLNSMVALAAALNLGDIVHTILTHFWKYIILSDALHDTFIAAALQGHLTLFEILLNKFRDGFMTYEFNPMLDEVLSLAAIKKRKPIVDFILNKVSKVSLTDVLSLAAIKKREALAYFILNDAFAENKVPTLSLTKIGVSITSLLRTAINVSTSEREVLSRIRTSLVTATRLRHVSKEAAHQGILSALTNQITQLPPELLALILSFALHPSRPSP